MKLGSEGIMNTNSSTVLNRESMHESRERHATKHQAVFGLDYSTWQRLVDAFEIKKPLIPHRAEERATQVGSRGWYS